MWTLAIYLLHLKTQITLAYATALHATELGLCCCTRGVTRGIDRAGAALPALLPEALREEARRGAAEGERADGLPAVGAARLEARNGGGGEHLVRVKGLGSGSGLP